MSVSDPATASKVVHIATTVYRREPRYDHDGFPVLETFVEAVFSDELTAKAYALKTCSDVPATWRSAPRLGAWVAGHRGEEMHFHVVKPWAVDDPERLEYLAGVLRR